MAKLFHISPHIKQGEEALQKGDNTAAVRYFSQALKKQEDMTVRNNLAVAQYNTGDFEGAWKTLQPNLHLKGELPSWHPFAHALASILLNRKGEDSKAAAQLELAREGYEDAQVHFESAMVDFDDNRQYLLMIMIAAGLLDLHETVMDLGTRWVRTDMPAECFYMMGAAFFNLELYEHAAATWRMAPMKRALFGRLALVAELMEEECLPSLNAEYTLDESFVFAHNMDKMFRQCQARGIRPKEALAACRGSRLLIMGLLFSDDFLVQEMAFFMESLLRGYGDWGIEFGQAIRYSAAFPAPMKDAATATFMAMGLIQSSGRDSFKLPRRLGRPPGFDRAAWAMETAMDKELPLDADLARCLKNLPALWLDMVCANLGIKKALMRRDREKQVFDILNNDKHLIKALLDDLDETESLILGYISQEDGWHYFHATELMGGLRGDKHSWYEYSPGTPVGSLISKGFLVAGRTPVGQFKRKVLVIPLELRPELEEHFRIHLLEEITGSMENVEINSLTEEQMQILDLVSVCAYFYGAIDLQDLYEQVDAIEKLHISPAEFRNLAGSGGNYDIEELLFDCDSETVSYFNAADRRLILAEQRQWPGLPYRPISRAEALAVLEDREDKLWNPGARNLEDWLRKHLGGSKQDRDVQKFARLAVMEIWQAILAGDEFRKVLKMLNDLVGYNNKASPRMAHELLVSMWEYVPRWSLKGWSPALLRVKFPDCAADLPAVLEWTAEPGAAASPGAVLKVGRNEPCPCGSGQKFKRCCGSKQD